MGKLYTSVVQEATGNVSMTRRLGLSRSLKIPKQTMNFVILPLLGKKTAVQGYSCSFTAIRIRGDTAITLGPTSKTGIRPSRSVRVFPPSGKKEAGKDSKEKNK